MGSVTRGIRIVVEYLPDNGVSSSFDVVPGERLYVALDRADTTVFFYTSLDDFRNNPNRFVGTFFCQLTSSGRVLLTLQGCEGFIGTLQHCNTPVAETETIEIGERVTVHGSRGPFAIIRIEEQKITPVPGRKDDGTKPDWSLLPWKGLETVVRVMEFGASKYGRDNWFTLPDARRRLFSAAVRHLLSRLNGEKNDQESGLPHLAHAACCVLSLLHFEAEDTLDSQ